MWPALGLRPQHPYPPKKEDVNNHAGTGRHLAAREPDTAGGSRGQRSVDRPLGRGLGRAPLGSLGFHLSATLRK